jgi:hypothetical protein
MVQGRTKPTGRGIAAESDRQVHQLGCRCGCAALARRLRGLVQRRKRDVVTPCRGQRQMPGPQLGFVDDVGEPPVHRAPLCRRGFGVHAPCQ